MNDLQFAVGRLRASVGGIIQSLALSLLALSVLMARPAWAGSGAWTPTATQAMPLKNIGLLEPIDPAAPLHLAVGLALRNKAQLDTFVQAAGNPGSVLFGSKLTPAQILAAYAPTTEQAQAVLDYLSEAGFTRLELSDNRLVISAYGPASAAETAFNTQLVQFQLAGRSVFANRTAVQVPAALQGTVAAVAGLQNIASSQSTLALDFASMPQGLGLNTFQIGTAFDAALFQGSYDAGDTPTAANTTIGILAEGDLTQVVKDLRQYEQENDLPQVPVNIVQTGPASTDTSGVGEFDLDSQVSTGMAGNVRELVLYDAASLNDADLIPAYQRVVADDSVQAVNVSFGACETLEYLSGAMLLADIAYETGVAEGITFFAAAGDAGASCAYLVNLGLPDTGIIGGVDYPASSPYVVAVGGTTLLINFSDQYIRELSWDAGGGGISLWENPPAWQVGVVPLAGNTELALTRGIPDVAMDADNNISPALVVINGANAGEGGTSLSTPLALGAWARIETAHDNCYGFAAPVLYSLISGLLTAPKGFHDITLGTNGLYVATKGWDYTTGIGSFDIAEVNAALPAVSCKP